MYINIILLATVASDFMLVTTTHYLKHHVIYIFFLSTAISNWWGDEVKTCEIYCYKHQILLRFMAVNCIAKENSSVHTHATYSFLTVL